MKMIMLALLMMVGGKTFAQTTVGTMTDDQLKKHYEQKIKECQAEMKYKQTQLKGDKGNADIAADVARLKANITDYKSKSKTVAQAIKDQKKYDSAIASADKAMKAAEKAAEVAHEKMKVAKEKKEKAEKLKAAAEEAARRTLYLKEHEDNKE